MKITATKKRTLHNISKSKPYQLSHRPHLRADAAWVLFQILENGKSSRDVLPKVFERHEGINKPWIQEMVFGCLRELPKLQHWLRQLLSKALKGEQKILEHLIMIGFYQLVYSRTSAHAAVSETVEACTVLKQHRLKGLVNANLRSFQREKLAEKDIQIPHIKAGLPKWLYKQLKQQYPKQVSDIAKAMNARPPLWLRVNTLKSNRSEYQSLLDARDIYTEKTKLTSILKELKVEAASALRLSKRKDITTLPGFDEGLFSVQDLAAQLAAELLDVQANQDVLDCCAAPGGKTAHILESQAKLASLDAIDLDGERLERIEENMVRLGHKQTFTGRLNLFVVDASNKDLIKSVLKNKQYDRILLDAPCSATGVIRRHPDIKWLRKATDIDTTVDLQKQILTQVWQCLKPGGIMLYATCSILRQENTEQIGQFLNDNIDAKLLPLHKGDTLSNPGLQILPGQAQMDGFYYARLLKSPR